MWQPYTPDNRFQTGHFINPGPESGPVVVGGGTFTSDGKLQIFCCLDSTTTPRTAATSTVEVRYATVLIYK